MSIFEHVKREMVQGVIAHEQRAVNIQDKKSERLSNIISEEAMRHEVKGRKRDWYTIAKSLPSEAPEGYIELSEARKIIGINKATIQHHITVQNIPGIKCRGKWYVLKSDAEKIGKARSFLRPGERIKLNFYRELFA